MQVRFKDARLEAGELIIRPFREDLGLVVEWVRNHRDRVFDLAIKEHTEKRSLNANAYAWVLIGRLAKVMRVKPVEIYRQQIRDLGGNYIVSTVREGQKDLFCKSWERNGLGWIAEPIGSGSGGNIDIICYYGSSEYDKATMGRLIDGIIQDCKAVGIETMTPEKLSLLKEEWNA